MKGVYMPWNDRNKMTIKRELVLKLLTNEQSITNLCKEYGISRKTAYKWLKRYENDGIIGLEDKPKVPFQTKSTNYEHVELIINTRRKFPAWGGRKLRVYLINEGYDVPSEPTFNRILKKHGLIDVSESEKRQPFIRFERSKPNELWQMDFKGHFQLKEGRCHPLTVLDDHSRFAICLNAYKSEDGLSVQEGLTNAFRMYGLPEAMTMDNGSPWKGSYPWRLSRLTVWLMRLGIKISHSSPGHPQTQGKDERFHRTIKEEILKYYQFKDLKDTQERFDEWKYQYNYIRPHEGIGMKRPADRYYSSPRLFPEVLPELIYEDAHEIRKVQKNGIIEFEGKRYFLGEHFYGELIGIKKVEDNQFDLYFSKTKLSRIDIRNN